MAANWTEFFNASTPASKRIALLQDGQQFAAIIDAQNGSSLASEASAEVTKVTLLSHALARVTFSVMLGGTPALADESGSAVLDNGVWQVGADSFCALLILENGNSKKGLPAPCQAVTG